VVYLDKTPKGMALADPVLPALIAVVIIYLISLVV